MTKLTPVYVYIAANETGDISFVEITPSLLEMEWIRKFGVDHLVWFEAFTDIRAAQIRATMLRELSDDQRAAVFLLNNPERLDLTPRIWASDPD